MGTPRCPASARATTVETPPRTPSAPRLTKTGLEAIIAARSLPVGHNVAATDGVCAPALAFVQAVANAATARATASLRVRMAHLQCDGYFKLYALTARLQGRWAHPKKT